MKQMTEACGCCEGIEIVTPQLTANRPGLTALSYRIGTHATFLETMLARLSGSDYSKLAELTTREADDPAIALLDAWAIVADVLTFYNERIINEGYLRTATERRSILELARLVGYRLRPGVSSSVYLAYSLDIHFKEEVTIPKGALSQSVPGRPGDLPQSFETSEDLKARVKWNNLKPRLTQPQTPDSISNNARLYLKGVSTNLKANDPLLIDLGNNQPEFFRVKEVVLDSAANRTLVTLQANAGKPLPKPVRPPIDLIGALTLPPSVQLANSLRLERKLKTQFLGSGIEPELNAPGLSLASAKTSVPPSVSLRKTLAGGEASHAALKAFTPVLRDTLALAVTNAQVTEKNPIKVYALRNKAALFGHNMPLPLSRILAAIPADEKDLSLITLALDAEYKDIKMQDWIAVERQGMQTIKSHKVEGASSQTLGGIQPGNLAFFSTVAPTTTTINEAGTSRSTGEPILAKSTVLTLDSSWRDASDTQKALLRSTNVYFQSEELELAEEPVEEPVRGGTDQLLELDGVYGDLESGRWVIVSGERDIDGTSGVRFSELAMLASVTQNVGTQMQLPANQNSNQTPVTTKTEFKILDGDRTRTFITLANKLEYRFKRGTVTIYGNVVKATHGETRPEVLGSGDGAKSLQSFTLKQPPLTYISASNPSGVDSTLKLYVNDVQWREADSLAGLAPTDRNFITRTDDEGKTTVVFGNGRQGALLQTGIENIKVEYRNGIGKSGNVNAGQITLLATRPLGVKELINPLQAFGGADKENRDQARKNAPIAVKALDRLVSVQDYEDFARIYAGIGKARAVELSDGRRQLVHVTIAGADDIPIDKNSDLYRNLRQSLLDSGDPFQAIRLEVRELMLMVIEARIRILPDYLWEPVVTKVRNTLLDAFSFERRELGQDVLLSEVQSVMQAVRGVAYVDVDVLGGIPEKKVDALHPGQRRLLTPGEIADLFSQPLKDGKDIVNEPRSRIPVNLAGREYGTLRPAQLAFLTPEVPATLNLNQIT